MRSNSIVERAADAVDVNCDNDRVAKAVRIDNVAAPLTRSLR